MKFRRKIQLLIALLALTAVVSGCKKEKNDSLIPDVPVDFYVYLSNPDVSSLNAVGGWAYVLNQGYKGIVIYRNGPETFSAFDRSCTYEPSKPCEKIDVEGSGLTAKDACCGSIFQITDGTVVQGPAYRSLKRYNTSWDGTKLRVYN